MVLSPNIAYCFDPSFAWDKNTESDIAGYYIYYKTGSSGAPYNGTGADEGDSPIKIPLANLNDPENPKYTIHGLSDTETFHFVATAYDIDDNESGYSVELSYQPSDAITVTPETPIITLISLSISGDDSVSESSNADYTATAFFSDGSTQIVTNSASWSENSFYAGINSSGLLTTSQVSRDRTVTIQASYTYNGSTETAAKTVTITNVTGLVTLTGLSISGVDSVNEASSAAYSATASFSNGSTQTVTSSSSWSENSDYADINSSGLLTTSQVSRDRTVTIQVSYTYNGSTETAAKTVTITDVSGSVTPTSVNALIRVNAGGGNYTDGSGHLWSADYGYNTGEIFSTSDPISGTADDLLYKTERWDRPTSPNLLYSFDLPNGDYTVNLYFAEIYSEASFIGGRVFDVLIEDQLVLVNLDIFSDVGHDAALKKTIDVTVTDGQLNIEFLHGIENPKISAIEVLSGF